MSKLKFLSLFILLMLSFSWSAKAQECAHLEKRVIELIRAERSPDISMVDFEIKRSLSYDSLEKKLVGTECHMLLSAIYREKGKALANIGQYDKAMATQRRAFDVAERVDSALSMASALNSIAKLHYRANQKDSALYYFKQCFHWFGEKGSIRGQLIALQNITENHFGLQEYDSAKVYCRALREMSVANDYTEGIIVADQTLLNCQRISEGPYMRTLPVPMKSDTNYMKR